ncbi:MAG: ABC transporter ATP-binding protein [Chloroflexi bacterium]|nr:MAG: ABC transporter ATP-binding protein [Chloroflexota bacterium]
MTLAVETKNLTKVYEKQHGWRLTGAELVTASAGLAGVESVTAVSGVNLAVSQGELFGLLGSNGAGKTTLTKMLCTLVVPTSGTAKIGGYDLKQTGAIRATVGLVVSNERSFYWRLSARRNLMFFAAMHGLFGQTAVTRVNDVLAAVELQNVAERRFGLFSSGMRQRLAIARSLLHQPTILFLDEPSRSLDPTATCHLHELIQGLIVAQNLTVFLITHDLAEAEKLCDRVALIHQSQIQAIGRPVDLRQQLQPQRRYRLTLDRWQQDVAAELKGLLPAMQLDAVHHELSFWASERDGLVTAVLDRLRAHQIDILTITATPPSLEEVFAHYTHETGEMMGDEG